ncbi:MAG: Ig-like domain-containing protein [Deltaproteobacteria bacterium]
MRSTVALSLLVAIAAGCGGGTNPPSVSSANSSLAVDRALAVANGLSVVTVSATIRDEGNGPMAGVTVAFSSTGGGNAWTPSSAVTSASGVATATLASTLAEAKTLGVTAGGLAVAQEQAVTFSVPAPSASRSSLAVNFASVIANGVSTTGATATVRDDDGVAMAGVTVTFSSTGTGNAWTPPSAVTSASGVATATLGSTVAEAKTLSVVAGRVAVSQTQPVTFTVPVPSASRSSLAASPPAAAANGLGMIAATATVRDADGVAMGGVTVRFAATGSGNVWTPSSAVTSASGIATAVIASSLAEVKTLSASAGGVAVSQTQPVTFTPAPVPAPDLVISELGNWYDPSVPAWVEIHNGTAAPVNLEGYTLRARGVDVDSGIHVASTTFPLPWLSVPSGGYAVVAGVVENITYNGGLLVHVSDAASRVPYWSGSGFVELVKDGATVDFVRIGEDTTAPTTAGYWVGAGAPALPTGLDRYDVALARRPVGAQTHGAADWVQVSFPTPGGPNDVAPDAVSSDGDGIPDSAKVPGGTFAGLDLHSMGARKGHRDIFIELDAMGSTDPGVIPRKEALDMVVAKFQEHTVYLHIDAGARFSATFNPALYNLGQPNWDVRFSACLDFPQDLNANPPNVPNGCSSVYAYKAEYMQVVRRAIFHYALFGSSQKLDGSSGSSGRADIIGSNFIVTLGNSEFAISPEDELNLLINQQASTFMHEFGHNLGLRHGGDEDLNYKPNYLSIMNYLHQMTGLPDPAAATAGDRYTFQAFKRPARCDLDASPCGSPRFFRMDFSNGRGALLDELVVSETGGLGRGGPWVDYDGNRLQNDGYSRSLLPKDVPHTWGKLHDFDDWSNLVLPFQPYANWPRGAPTSTLTRMLRRPVTPFNDHQREVSQETPPGEAFFEEMRQRRQGR